jgi:hypothetical protein
MNEKCIAVTRKAEINVPNTPTDIYLSISKYPIIKKEKKYTANERHNSSFSIGPIFIY